jgi:hypothetical protein
MRNWNNTIARRDAAECQEQGCRKRTAPCIELAEEIAEIAESDSEFERMLAEEVEIKNYRASKRERDEFIRDFCGPTE